LVGELDVPRREESLREFTSEWYDEKYFSDPEGKRFVMEDGSVRYWGYRNPTGWWEGCVPIARAWKAIFNPRTLLDVGCGRAQFVLACRKAGMEAYGFDYSEWALTEGLVEGCDRGWVRLHDATKPWPYEDGSMDVVVCLDTLEHIYEEDLEKVIGEMYRVSSRWIFLEIATVDGVRERGFILHRGEPIPLETDPRTWAGHVTVCTEAWWYDRLEEHDRLGEWMPRRDLVNWFRALVDEEIIRNWVTIIVMERIQ